MYALPEVIRHLDELTRADLESLRDSYFLWLLLSSGVVALGVILEGPEIVHEIIGAVRGSIKQERRTPTWITWFALAGWLLVVVGVAGEGVAEALVSKADGLVQTFNEILLTDAQRESARAEERAANAEAELQSAKTDAALARKDAEGFRLQITQSNERAAKAEKATEDERLARVKIEERLAPRSVDKEQQRRIVNKLKPFSGTPYELTVDPIPEAINLLAAIDSVLRSSGWINKESERKDFRFISTLPSGSKVEQEYFSGVIIRLTQTLLVKRRPAAEALVRALQAEGIDTRSEVLPETDPSPNAIHVMVGSKE